MQKRKEKEAKRQRHRSNVRDEEQGRLSTLSSFESDVQSLKGIVTHIEAYERSSKPQELQKIQSKVDKIVERINAKKKEQEDLYPKVESVRRAVEDQGRYKTNLGQNIDILEARENAKALKKEIAELKEKRSGIEGIETAQDEYEAAKSKKDKLLQDKARCDGLWQSHVEQIRALQASRNSPAFLILSFVRVIRLTHNLSALIVSSAQTEGRGLQGRRRAIPCLYDQALDDQVCS